MLTKEQEETIQQLMKTSADDVMDSKQTKTNIELAHKFLDGMQSGRDVSKETALAQVYSNLAIADQLVLLNRSLGLLTQIMMQQRQGGIVVPQGLNLK